MSIFSSGFMDFSSITKFNAPMHMQLHNWPLAGMTLIMSGGVRAFVVYFSVEIGSRKG